MPSVWPTAFFAGIFVCASVSHSATSTTVRSLRVDGNRAVSTPEVERWLSTRPGTRYNGDVLQGDLRRIEQEYTREGYWSASARVEWLRFAPDSSTVDIALTVLEGRPVLIGGISLTGLAALEHGEVLDRFESRVGSLARQPLLEADLLALLHDLEQKGFAFAECAVRSAEVLTGTEADSLMIEVEVREGKQVTIEEIRIEGAKETDPDYILRETRLRKGELFSPERVRAVRDRLNRLNIFTSVSEPVLYSRDGHEGLLVTVQEGRTNTFDGLIGYVPPATGQEKGSVVGLLSLSMRNLFGTGRKILFRWNRDDRSVQELTVRYTEPWLFGLPVNLGGGFLQRQQDSAYVRRQVDLRGELIVSDRFSVGMIGASEITIPSAEGNSGRAYSGSALTIGADATYDSRDDALSPTGGVRYAADYHYGRKTLPPLYGSTKSSIQRFGLDLELYVEMFQRQVFALGVHGRQVTGTALQEGELYRFGGTRTLRGYRENEFLGSRITWANVEYRFLLGRRTFFFGFVDGGYYFRPEDPGLRLNRRDEFKHGIGVGVRVDTVLGNMGVSVAFGEGDSFTTAKFHVGLLTEF